MRIGELAAATGTSARSLRHYEDEGLIASERAANGYRIYEAAAVVRVRNIRLLLDAGLTLADVRTFLPCLGGDLTAGPPSPAALRVARHRLGVLEERIAAQTAVRDRLAERLDALGEQIADGPADRGTGREDPDARRAGREAGTSITGGR